MADQTLASLTAATPATGGLLYGTQSGADRKFTLSAAGAALMEAATTADQRTALGCAGLEVANIFAANGAASSPGISLTGTAFTGGTSTTTKPLFLIEPSGTTSTDWSTYGTMLGINVPSEFVGDVFRFSKNGSMVFKMGYESSYDNTVFTLSLAGMTAFDLSHCMVTMGNFGTPSLAFGFGQIRAAFGFGLILGSTSSSTSGDNVTSIFGQPSMTLDWGAGAILASDEAHVLSQRNSTNPQSLRVYGTYTDSNNYERLSLITTSGAYSIKPEAAGTGTLRELHISGLPTSNPGPGILWNNAGTPAIGT